ncbi:RRP15-like protein [Condylostylus longicornis]|uniref:RRP15-like protein n=1 Tax=Condylostylus longicornis TaxID=2530218 RepID=UPI00244E5A54|nr:RRP15-like protein [Condylostylus longicornis]
MAVTKEMESSQDWNFGWTDCINKELANDKFKKTLTRKRKIECNSSIEEEFKEKKANVVKTESKCKSMEASHRGLRIKPSVQDLSTQKVLKKIATKGVVHFFNAVKSQQKMVEAKMENERTFAQREDFKLKNIDKTKFLDILLGTPKSELVR